MSDFLFKMRDYLPLFTWVILWLALLPIRAVALLLLPPMNYRIHPLRKVRDFFDFERG